MYQYLIFLIAILTFCLYTFIVIEINIVPTKDTNRNTEINIHINININIDRYLSMYRSLLFVYDHVQIITTHTICKDNKIPLIPLSLIYPGTSDPRRGCYFNTI